MTSNPMPLRVRELLNLAGTQQRHAEALAKATGEHFNLFQILRVGHLEVTTHSPLLADLLNPKGKHGQGSIFLDLFLIRCGVQGFDAATAKVKMEHHIGAITADSGGRIDILICDARGGMILLENKIHAPDQLKQLQRYRTAFPKAHLIYLTLKGKGPADGANLNGLKCISYAVDILEWVKDCRRESAMVPTVREALSQYIHLIQDLTHQNTNSRMSQEITQIVLQNEASYQAFVAVRNSDRQVRATILSTLNVQLGRLAEEMELCLDKGLSGSEGRYDGWIFTGGALSAQGLKICFECEAAGYRAFYCGFAYQDTQSGSPVADRLREAFKMEFSTVMSSTGWAAYGWWDQHRNWDDDTFASIQFGAFIEDVRSIMIRFLNVLAISANPLPAASHS